MDHQPYDYPRAGQRGCAPAADFLKDALLDLVEFDGLPVEQLGPTLVQAYAQVYRRLPVAGPIDKTQVPLLYSLLGSGTSPLKMNRQDAAYQDSPHASGQRCANCSSSYASLATGEVICNQIEGLIERDGWCRLWNTDRG